MDSREIALAVKEKERRKRLKEQKERDARLQERSSRESTPSRVEIVAEQDGETLLVKPRPLYRYFTSFGTDSFWFICISAIAFPIVATVFGVSMLSPWIDNLFARIFLVLLACITVMFLLFVGFKTLKDPTVQVKVTPQGFYAITTFSRSRPASVGKVDELHIAVSEPNKNTGWGSFDIRGGTQHSFTEIKPKDLGRVQEFCRRHKIEEY